MDKAGERLIEAKIEGPAGQVALGNAVVTIGRALDNTLVVNDSKASLHHAEVRPQESGHSILDLHSMNGTFVNEQRISIARVLKASDRVRVGNTTYIYRVNGSLGSIPDKQRFNLFARFAALFALQSRKGSAKKGASSQEVGPTGNAGGSVPQAAWRLDRKGLLLIIGGSILLLGMVVGMFLAYMLARATPAPSNVLATYCGALKNQDYETAYHQLDSNSAKKFSILDFSLYAAQNGGSGRVVACSVGGVHTTGSRESATGTIDFTYADTSKKAINYVLNSTGGQWRITQSEISSPSAMLALYCTAIRQHNYAAAYAFWSKGTHAVLSEADFTAKFTRAAIATCTISAVQEHGTTATVTITYGATDGSTTPYNAHLINEDGFWRLNDQQQ